MALNDEQLIDKVVLEIGSGLGRTTRGLATWLSSHSGAKLIVTDITDRYFDKIRSSLDPSGIQPQFIQTEATELAGIENDSIDYIVCNFALCEINSDIGRGTLALAKFLSVLKTGGKLHMEEEMPVSAANGPTQQSWALIWRILKSAQLLTQQKTATTEYNPDVLRQICEIVGFTDVKWEAGVRSDTIGWLDPRIELLSEHMQGFPSPQVKQMFVHLANDVKNRAHESGQIDIPIYTLTAEK